MWKSRIPYLAVLILQLVFLPINNVMAADGEYVYRASTEVKSEMSDITIGAQSGAFIFDQNLDVPAGRNGLQPDLKLQYNNQDEDQSNIAGYGWSFSIPSVQRLSKTGVDKMYDANYFSSSLSGELLPTEIANQYGAKVETGSFLNYTFNNNKWVVTDKTGMTYTFGNDASARQDDVNNPAHVYKWMLSEIRDANDNFVKYEYSKDNGQIYPARVVYTGHGTTDGIYEVVFNREARLDTSVMYNAGFKIKTQYRISNITIKTNGVWTKKYDLNYVTGDNGKRSLLSGITESGNKDGNILTLPPTTFTYQTKEKGFTYDGDWGPKWLHTNVNAGYTCSAGTLGDKRILDLNGDGIMDMTSAGPGNYCSAGMESAVNTGNKSFNGGPTIPETVISTSGRDNAVRFDDLNGDGMMDLVQSKQISGRYAPSPTPPGLIYLSRGFGQGYDYFSTTTIPVFFINEVYDYSSTHADDLATAMGDINGDGLADLLQNNYLGNKIFLNKGNGTNWEEMGSEYTVPVSIQSFYNQSFETVTMDVNGDGLLDFVVVSHDDINVEGVGSQTYPKLGACINMDGGKHYDCSYGIDTLGAPASYSRYPMYYDNGGRFLDVNGDGLVDFVRKGIRSGSLYNGVFINKGDGTGWTYDTTQPTVPVEFMYDIGAGNWAGNSTRAVDMNGDGLTDFMDIHPSGNVYLNNGKKPDILIRVDHSKGAITEVTYKTAQMFKKADGSQANPKLPFMMHVADKVTTDDGMGNKATTSYQYEGGKYYFNNYLDKRFAGFNLVVKTDALGNMTKQYFHQGDYSDTSFGERADHPAKINMMYREDALDSSGNLQTKTMNKFEVADLGNNRNFVFNSETVKKSYDSTGAQKDIAESSEYNNLNGNLTKKTEWGEISAQNDGTFTDIGVDSRIHTYSYTTNGTNIIGLPSQEVVTDSNGGKIRETISYYDNLPFGQVSVGNKTKDENWVTDNQYVSNRRTYNIFGLVTGSYDANNNLTTSVYDVYNLYPVTVTNALSQTTQYQYDYSVGKQNRKVDANNYVSETSFDPLGRVKQERIPDVNNQTSLVVSVEYFYNDNSNPRVVQTKKYLDSTNTVDSFTYINGLDKTVQERTEAENGFAVKDFVYNKLGLVQKESLAYFSAGSTQTTPSTNNNLYTNYTYDGLNRVKTIVNAVGTTLNNYFNWKVSTADAKGNSKDYYNDAFGRLVQVTEKITNPAPENYNTYYEYDGNNNLTKITDALGNVRNFGYDGLGRRLLAEDLHAQGDTTFGVWNYAYDNNGNLINQTDPKNQTVVYNYDSLNRKTTEDSATQTGIEVTYTYDTGCTNSVGRLCSVVNNSVTINNNYNALGQVVNETKTIDSVNYNTQYIYDRAGNIVSTIYPDNSEVKNQYNSAGQLESVSKKESTDSAFVNVVNNFDYSPLGQITYQEDGNGTATTNIYNPNELYRLQNKKTELLGIPPVPGQGTVKSLAQTIQNLTDWNTGVYNNTTSTLNLLSLTKVTGTNLVSTESFEISTSTEWLNKTGDSCDWAILSGDTPTLSTGPSTTKDGSFYAYVETSPGFCNKRGNTAFYEHTLTATTTGRIEFNYHMYGTNSGTLRIDALVNNAWKTLWSIKGNKGNSWSALQTVNYATNAKKIRFVYTAVGGDKGDVAIDLVKVYEKGEVYTNGTWISKAYDLSSIADASGTVSSTINWISNTPNNTNVSVFTGISSSATVQPTVWDSATNGGQISNIPSDSAGKYLWIKTNLNTNDGINTPTFSQINFAIDNSTVDKRISVKVLQDISYTYDQVGNIMKMVEASNLDTAKTNEFAYDDLYRLKASVVTNAKNNDNYTENYNYDAIGNIVNKYKFSSVDYLLVGKGNFWAVGGGGGGGAGQTNNSIGAGGGAGGYVFKSNHSLSVGSYYVNVGAGGVGGMSSGVDGANGTDSIFDGVTALGGGGGAGDGTANNGASGGGASMQSSNRGLGVNGQGFDGGNGGYTSGGGGGGASGIGSNGNGSSGGNGGNGIQNSVTGLPIYYAGGGGGGADIGTPGIGGLGGGGNGTSKGGSAGFNGADNTGGGGGGGSAGYGSNVNGGNGGSGVVIISYITSNFLHTGGDETGVNGLETWVKFNTSGTFTLDAPSSTHSSTISTDYVYSGENYTNPHAVTQAGNIAFAYDQNGNQTTDGTWMNTWDYDNRLISSVSPSTTINYIYDQSGQRIKKTENGKISIYPNKLYNIEDGKIKKHIFAGDNSVATIDDGKIVYHHTDHLSGSSVETDKDGLVVEAIDYYPFGSVRTDNQYTTYENDKKFTGYELDGNDLYYAGQRYYNSDVGRFVSIDPLSIVMGTKEAEQIAGMKLAQLLADPQNLNSYSYVKNNPLRYTDPDGQFVGQIGREMAASQRTAGNFLNAAAEYSHQQGGIIGHSAGFVTNMAGNFVNNAANIFDSDASAGTRGLAIGLMMFDVATGGEGNAAKNVVYQGFDEAGKLVYVGITKNFEKRVAQHAGRFAGGIRLLNGAENLTRSQARGIEQMMIEKNGMVKNGGQLWNKINSISTSNPMYKAAKEFAENVFKK